MVMGALFMQRKPDLDDRVSAWDDGRGRIFIHGDYGNYIFSKYGHKLRRTEMTPEEWRAAQGHTFALGVRTIEALCGKIDLSHL